MTWLTLPGGGRDILGIKGLNGIHGQEVRLELGGPVEKIFDTGPGHNIQVFRLKVQPISSHFDLLRGFFTGKVQGLQPPVCKTTQHLQNHGGFSDTGVPPDQNQGTGNQTAPEGAVKLRNSGSPSQFGGKGNGVYALGLAHGETTGIFTSGRLALLQKGPPLITLGAPAQPLQGFIPAVPANIF